MRVLVVEDSLKMAGALQKGLAEHGFSVDVSNSGEEGEEMAASQPYDVIVLDLMLPDRDGMDVCANLRRRDVKTPILMLTALSGTSDKVAGLNKGADDYLCKPFDFNELVARLRALMRRSSDVDSAILRYADVVMNLSRREVTRQDVPIELTQKEFALLEYFMRNPETVLARTAISDHVWDMNYDPFSNVIDVYVSALRKKIDKPFEKSLIHTVVGVGYRFADNGDES